MLYQPYSCNLVDNSSSNPNGLGILMERLIGIFLLSYCTFLIVLEGIESKYRLQFIVLYNYT